MEIVERVLHGLEDYCNGVCNDISVLDGLFQEYMEKEEKYRVQYAENLSKRALDIIHKSCLDCFSTYYIMSFFVKATDCKLIYRELLQLIIEDENSTKEMKFVLYGQLVRYSFVNSTVMDEEKRNLLDDLYSQIYLAYTREVDYKLQYIEREARNPDFVIVFISQVLGMGHAPTKALLDRCYVLEEYMQKRVYIVNTAELMTEYRIIPYFAAEVANYIEEYSQKNYLEYKGKAFPFFQCPREMPQIPIIRGILELVKTQKPYFIMNIGGNSIVSDLCSNIVPTITISTSSERAQTRGQFQVVCRKIEEEDRRWMRKHSLPEDHIIESVFTFSFAEQTHHYTRRELSLPENRFIVLVVGYRLDKEITSDFMQVLENLTEQGIFIAFMGVFDQYHNFADKSEVFKANSVVLGCLSDSLAVCECCDLYLNPKRMGGGTSGAEALFKGLPVVTFDYGDVGVCAGSDFHVKDWDEMRQQVMRYFEDEEYYSAMSKSATERAEYLADSRQVFARIIKKMEESRRF